MERKILLPDNPHIILEIKRLINAVVPDSTDNSFDIFENDVFIFFDPEDGLEEDQENETSNSNMIEVDPPQIPAEEKTDLQENLEQGIEEGDFDEDDDFIDDECDHDEEPQDNPFRIFMPLSPDSINKNHSSPPTQSFDDLLEDLEEEDDEDDANFVYKPTGLKFWWRTGDGKLYVNRLFKYRELFNIINHCIASMGRRTQPFLVRYHYYGADGNEKM